MVFPIQDVYKRQESDCMLFGAEAYTTVRWIGNELGYANEETWSKSKVDYEKNTCLLYTSRCV